MRQLRVLLIGLCAVLSTAQARTEDKILPQRVREWCEGLLNPAEARLRTYTKVRTEIEAKLMSRLGFVPRIEAKLIKDGDNKTFGSVLAYDRQGLIIAYTSSETTSGRTLYIGRTEITHGIFKNKGIAELMFAHLIMMQPKARRITARLLYDNERIVNDLVAAGWSCEDAIRQTPAAKIRARFGFTTFGEPPFCRSGFSLMLILDRPR